MSFNGIGVEFSVPGKIHFKGEVSYKEDGNLKGFTGGVLVELPAANLTIEGQVVFGSDLDAKSHKRFKYFALYLDGEFGKGIPLWSTDLALYGIAGLFSVNYAPDKPPEMLWYSMEKAKSWFHEPPVGVTDIVAKWAPERESLALGAGATIATFSDNGFKFNGSFLLLLLFPGPVLMIEGRANFLKERAALKDEPQFHALVVLDARAGYFLIGLDAKWKADENKGALAEISGSAEAFFNFHDPRDWHLYLGKREPMEQRIRAVFARLFTANSYFMLDPKSLAVGVWIGKEDHWKFGPVKADLEAWLDANALVSFNPAQFHADLWIHGRVAVKVFKFRLGIGVDARLAADVAKPFHLVGELALVIETRFKDFHIQVRLEWGPRPERPEIPPEPFRSVGIGHFKSTAEWALPASGAGSLVPMDCRPYVTFEYPVHDAIGIGVNPAPDPGWVTIGDPATGEGSARVRFALEDVVLRRDDGTVVAHSPPGPGEEPLYGSWAPSPSPPGQGAAGQNKLWLWSKNPLDHAANADSWNPWLTDHLPGYPCPVVPEVETCIDFAAIPHRTVLSRPWSDGEHPDVQISWGGGRGRTVVDLRQPVDGVRRGLRFPAVWPLAGPFVYVGRAGDATLLPLLTTTDSMIDPPIPVGDKPGSAAGGKSLALAITADGRRLLVAEDGGTVVAINTATNRLAGVQAGVTANPRAIVVTPDGKKAYVTSASTTSLVVFDPGTLAVLATLQLRDVAEGIAVTPDGAKVYVAHPSSGWVSVVETAGDSQLRPIHVQAPVRRLAAAPLGDRLYLASAETEGRILQLDTTTDSLVGDPIPVGDFPRALAVTPDGARLYVANGWDDTVSVIDTKAGRVTTTLAVGNHPLGLALTPDGRRLYVTNTSDGTLSVVDTATETVLPGVIAAGSSPEAMAVTPGLLDVRRWPEPPVEPQVPPVLIGLPPGTRRAEVLVAPNPGVPEGAAVLPRGAQKKQVQVVDHRLVFDAEALGLPRLERLRLTARLDWILLRVCVVQPDRSIPQDEVTRVHSDIDRHLALWEKPGAFLDPLSDYELEITVTRQVQGLGKLKGWAESADRSRKGIFRTSGPPGLGTLSAPLGGGDPDQRATGLDDLDRYVEQTLPATVPADGELPWLPKPFYRAYDVGLRFNEDYVEGLYARARRPLTLHLHDNNDRPVRNARGDLLSLSNPWGEAEAPVLTEVEARWVEMVGAAPCLPHKIDPELIPRHQTLAAAAGHVVEPDAVYEARLLPHLLLEDFTDASSWQADGEVLVLRDGPAQRWPDGTPASWSDYRLEALVQPVARRNLVVAFRFRDPDHHYRLTLRPAANRRQLEVVEGGTPRKLADSGFVYRAKTAYALTIEAVGPRLRVLQDGEPVFDVEDEVYGSGRIALFPWDGDAAKRFLMVRVEDFRKQAPAAYRFRFTSSLYTDFFHHLHSFDDVVWPAEVPAGFDATPLTATAADLSMPPGDAETRAYDVLAEAVLGPAAAHFPPRVEVTRVEQGGAALAFLLRSPEPLGGTRLRLEMLRAAAAVTAWTPPGALKVTDADWNDDEPGGDTITLLLREPVDLTRRRVEVRRPPGPLAGTEGDPILLLPDFGRPESFDGFEVVDRGDQGGPSRWNVAEGALLQKSNIKGGSEPDDPGTLALAGEPYWADLRVTTRLRSDGRGALGVVFRYTDPENFYRLAFDARRGFTRLVRRAAGKVTVLWQHPESFTVGEPFAVVVVAAGPRLRGFVDGDEIFDVQDPAHPQGRVGLYAYGNAWARCLDFEVRYASLEARELFGDRFADGDLAGWSRVDEAAGGASSWALADGALRVSSPVRAGDAPRLPGTLAVSPATVPREFVLDVRFESPTGGAVGIVFLRRDLENFYRFSASQREGYRLLIRTVDGVAEELWRDTAGYDPARAHRLTLVVAQGSIRGHLDGVPVFAVRDEAVAATPSRFALYCRDNADARFSRVRLYPGEAALRDWLLDEPFAVHLPQLWSWEMKGAPSPDAWDVEGGALRPASPWSALSGGTDNVVHALASQGDDLFVGGTFRSAGGAAARCIAHWDGERFHPLGDGVNGPVRAVLAITGGRWLVVAGNFSRAGDAAAGNVAVWDRKTESWSLLGDGVDGPVLALVMWQKSLIVGGRFTQAGGQPARNLARWDPAAATWEEVGGGVDGDVHALAEWSGNLVVGGAFTDAGGQDVQRVAAWDGQSWDDLDGGVNGLVRALTATPGGLVAAGRFTVAGGLGAHRIARFQGNKWSALGDKLDGEVFAVVSHGTQIVAGGQFEHAGASPVPYIARWNPVVDRWYPVGTGTDGRVRAIAGRDGSLHVGGDFQTAGDRPMARVAHVSLGVVRTAITGEGGWRDYRLSARLRPGFDGASGVLFRYRDRRSFYALLVEPERGRIRLIARPGGQVTELWKRAFVPAPERDYLLTVDCFGKEIAGFLDGVPLFRLDDASLESGAVGLVSTASAGARMSELRVAAPVWSPLYAFGREEPLAAGTRVVIHSGSDGEAPPPAGPAARHRFAVPVGERDRLRLPPDRADLRVVGPGRNTGHARRCVRGAGPIAVKVLRRADGTALAVLPADSPTLAMGTYGLALTYHRDLGDDSPRLSQAGVDTPERVRLDLPWNPT